MQNKRIEYVCINAGVLNTALVAVADDGDDNRNPAALERLLGDHANKASTPSTGGDAEAEPSKPRTRRRVRKI